MTLNIQSYCSFTENGITKNGNLTKANAGNSFEEFALEVYKEYGLGYSKFHKMDNLCKLAILTAEFLLTDVDLEILKGDKTAIILGNDSSSIVSDTAHFKSMYELPSPAVFVYTLPNIMTGEMCIKYKITGENQCFEMKRFDASFLNKYVSYLFEKENYNKCITGFVDFSLENYQAHLFLITKENNSAISKFDADFNKLNTH